MPRRDEVSRRLLTGLRITNFKGRAVIAFSVGADLVSIIGVFYGGRDYQSLLEGGPEDDIGS